MRLRSKYGAKKTEVDGILFASQKEARRYQELKLLQLAGEIHGLSMQPRFKLTVQGADKGTFADVKLGEYRGDFVYCKCRRGAKCELSQRVIEDVKGFKTPLYRWKKKHVEAQYGITILET